jgi:hypothetical protein
MSKSAAVLLAVALYASTPLSGIALASRSSDNGGPASSPSSSWGTLPVSFVENRGQIDASVRFAGTGGAIPIFFTDRDVRLVLSRGDTRTTVILEMVDARPTGIVGGRPTGGRVNYLREAATHTEIPAYRDVIYREAWPGIDVVFRADAGKLSYDFILRPGARPADIRLRVHGADALSLSAAGDLRIATAVGDLTDTAPETYQEVGGRKQAVVSRFVLRSLSDVGFAVGEYDNSQPLVIDPSIIYATYLGGSGSDFGTAIAVDPLGAAYVAGFTVSAAFPVTPGVLDTSPAGGSDGFVAKIAPNGDAFEYITYLGGSGSGHPMAIAIDGTGNAYVTGDTFSSEFRTTTGAFRTIKGAHIEAFVAKLNARGTALLYSTFLGGNADTGGRAIAVDTAGQAHIVGWTRATNLPLTAGAIDGPRTANGTQDGFLVKLNSQGSAVAYGTYLGGSGHDFASDVAVDHNGHAYVVGYTQSTDLRTSHGAVQPVHGGYDDAFVIRVNTLSTTPAAAFVYGTYIGGSSNDEGRAIAVDGYTQTAYVGVKSSNTSARVMKLNPHGTAFEYATHVGPQIPPIELALAIDDNGIVYVAGAINVFSGPGFYRPRPWISRLDARGLESASKVFEVGSFRVAAIATDGLGNAYITGSTSSAEFPVTAGAPQPTYAGAENFFAVGDAFIAKISFADIDDVNIAQEGIAVASSVEAAHHAASAAVDGDPQTRWSSRFSDPEWIYVDLGARYAVNRVVLHWETAFASEFALHISDDAVNWYPLRDSDAGAEFTSDGGIDSLTQLQGAGRYVRVFGLTRATQWGHSLWEIEIYGTPDATPAPPLATVNVGLRPSASGTAASSVESSRGDLAPSHAFDGDLTTRWSSDFSDPQSIVVDLGASMHIARVVLRWETAYGADYSIRVSDDRQTWRTIRQVVNGDGDVDELNRLSGTGRYVMMHGTRRGTPWGYSLWEFEVYGVINDGPTRFLSAPSDIVLYGVDAMHLHDLSVVADSSAALGHNISSTDSGRSWLNQPPPAGSAPYAHFAFRVREPGDYRVWMRMRGQGDSKWNESVWVQFSGATRDGTPVYRWESAEGLLVNLENCFGCGIRGWGWQDNSWWLNQSSVVHLDSGVHELYVTLREDGVEFDQIVLSREHYATTAPGPVADAFNMLRRSLHAPLHVDAGTFIASAGGTFASGRLSISGPDGFSISFQVSNMDGAVLGILADCGGAGCPGYNDAAGSDIPIFAFWSASALRGSTTFPARLTYRGNTYARLWDDKLTSGAFELRGAVTIPPISSHPSTATVVVPFTATGVQTYSNDNITEERLDYFGSGQVTLTLRSSDLLLNRLIWLLSRAEFVFHRP